VRLTRGLYREAAPIVVCSHHEPTAAEMDGLTLDGFLRKPFSLPALSECLDAALAQLAATHAPILTGSAPEGADAAFYSALAHDLRTPMATLRTAVESLLAEDVEWDAEARHEFLTAIAASAERVSRYARDVVDLARLEAGAMRLNRQHVDPLEILEVAVRRLGPPDPAQAAVAVCSHADPATAAWADPSHMLRILEALLENAVQRSPERSTVRLEVTANPDEVCWRVLDEGPGVAVDYRELIFEKQFRGQPQRRGSGVGPGLNLYIGRVLAQLQGGRLWVEETERGGACFCLALPVAPRVA
jgi:K+-sensing histidine kinase KdpD